MNINTNHNIIFKMKTIIQNTIKYSIGLYLSLLPTAFFAQSSNQNYISERAIKVPITNKTAISTLTPSQQNFKVTYYDKFGRAIQSVVANGSGNAAKDLVSTTEYDIYNRKIKAYLPAPIIPTTAGNYVSNANTSISTFYNTAGNYASTTKPFSEIAYEKSAEERVFAVGQAGENFQLSTANTTRYKYEMDQPYEVQMWYSQNDSLFPYQTNKNGFGNLIPEVRRGAKSSPHYQEEYVRKTRTYDPNGRQSIQYLNEMGLPALIRDQIDLTVKSDTAPLYNLKNDSASFTNTYFVYDFNNQLIYLIPPNAAKILQKKTIIGEVYFNETQDIFKEMIYGYRYDSRGRKVGVKIPGKEWEVTIYNKADQPVLVQNGAMRALGKWQFIKYDYMGRVVMTGLYSDATSTIEALHTAINNQSLSFESKTTASTNFYYSNAVFPKLNTEILTVNYYDEYPANLQVKTFQAFGGFTANTNAIKGLATGALIKILDSSPAQYLMSVIYYDEYNRPIQTYKEQYCNIATWDRIDNTYNFAGELLQSTRYHTGAQNLTLQYRYEYDHAGRKTKTYFKANADPEVVHSDLKYNEIGQLIEKNIHGTGTSPTYTYMQSIDYRYTINGWLSSINNSKLDSTGTNNDKNDAFGMELYYETPPTNLPINGGTAAKPVVAQYNGNISASVWKSKDLSAYTAKVARQSYSYQYDPLDRLVSAKYSTEAAPNNNIYTKDIGRYNESLTYDRMGNILSLQRYGRNSVLIDNLNYSYNVLTDYSDSIPVGGGGGGPWGTTSIGTGLGRAISNIGNGNKLFSISETALNDVNFNDFKDLKGGNKNKYVYDTDGRLKNDSTKKVNYVYNHLDLPTVITNTVDGTTLNFIYDATGRKLARTIPNSTTIHYYMGGIESEFTPDAAAPSLVSSPLLSSSSSTLQTTTTSAALPPIGSSGSYAILFAATEEGRIRPKTAAANTYFFDYFLKDHLGNIRVSLSDELPIVNYPTASVEDKVGTSNYANNVVYEKGYYSIPPTRVVAIPGSTTAFGFNSPALSTPPTAAQLAAINKNCIRLYHNTNDSLKVWLPKILKVNSGDKISATVNAFYTGTVNTSSTLGNGFFGTFVNSMVNNVPAGIPTSDIIGKLQTNFSSSGSAFSNTINSIYNNTYNPPTPTTYNPGTKPKAYLLLLFYDNDFTLLKDQSYIREIQSNSGVQDVMTLTDKIANVAGYCQMAIVNECSSAVYFDKFKVTHKQSNTTELNDFYPYGLQNQQTSSTQYGSKEQRYKYNGKELFKDFKLEMEDYGARLYNPQIARWSLLDPLADKYTSYSPYNFVLGNPIRLIDPNGMEPHEPEGPGYYAANVNSRMIGFSIRYPVAASRIGAPERGGSNISSTTVRFSTALDLQENKVHEGSQVNAYRHALWQSAITQQYGSGIASEIGNAHEENPLAATGGQLKTTFYSLSAADETVDLLNNMIGRAIGQANSNASFSELASKTLDYYKNVGLWSASPVIGANGRPKGYSISLNRLTQEQYDSAKKKLNTLNNKGRNPEQQKASDIAEQERMEARADHID
jgi:RHS repeat-associated protein